MHRIRISKRFSTIGSNPLIPSKFRVQDPKLLTEASVKNRQLTPSEEARVHGLQRIAMDVAGYSKAPTTAKRAFWSFWLASSVVFVSILYNVVENYLKELELFKIGESAAKEFIQIIIEKNYDYEQLKPIFLERSKENIMTFALGKVILIESKKDEELKFKIIAARNFLHFVVNEFKTEDVKMGTSLSGKDRNRIG
ncbi:Oidioi.mRNA.OKI2018_I69.chr2.g5013.t1.cds [Oikopleura dioica]|uniref:Oidioi.mRNA.OKI2018_I69.chr2.g5013.t1.cds n=1 Tax=Oikopleura dioica TaxID=34765 RepID=A0ABN7T3G3_OIKDI|nr:Oidioi.mRNA.OKI2018_I69.chr2.g5013.t1.cds [Oikopleura dioica]